MKGEEVEGKDGEKHGMVGPHLKHVTHVKHSMSLRRCRTDLILNQFGLVSIYPSSHNCSKYLKIRDIYSGGRHNICH